MGELKNVIKQEMGNTNANILNLKKQLANSKIETKLISSNKLAPKKTASQTTYADQRVIQI